MALRALFMCLLLFGCRVSVLLADSSPPSRQLQTQLQPGHPALPSQSQTTASLAEQLHDIAPPVPLPSPIPWPLVIGTMLVAAAALAAVWWLRRQRKTPIPPAAPPWTVALAELEAARSLLDTHQPRQYLSRLSEILRSYFELRYQLASTRQTTREFLHSLQDNHRRELQPARTTLKDFLEQADLAKFAHNVPDTARLLELSETVRQLITTTIPAEGAS
jgi:hypothetical protein